MENVLSLLSHIIITKSRYKAIFKFQKIVKIYFDKKCDGKSAVNLYLIQAFSLDLAFVLWYYI